MADTDFEEGHRTTQFNLDKLSAVKVLPHDHPEQASIRKRTMKDTDGGPHPAVDGQSLSESEMVTGCRC